MKEQLVDDLQDLIGRTETLYSRLADTYPSLLHEIENSLENSSSLVHELRSSLGFQGQRSRLDTLFDQARSIIGTAGSKFEEIHRQDDELLASLNESIEKIESLEANMDSIRESTEEMELISLNAMTVAIKAGKAGGAFSYITDELQRLSSRTISSTHDLTAAGSRAGKSYREFGRALKETKSKQQQVFQDFDSNLTNGFDTFRQSLQQTIETIDSIHSAASEIRPSLFDIMQEIQHQDIIRQSIDHVIYSLGELDEPQENGDDEFLLDELAFYQQLPNLCISVLDDIKNQIYSSVSVFHEQTGTIRAQIENVDEIHAGFAASQVNEAFTHSTGLLEEITTAVGDALVVKEKVTELSAGLLKEIEELELKFKSFSSLVGRFHNINIAAKIEIAKQAALSGMSDTVEEMTTITDTIQGSVEEALRTIRGFIKKTRNSLKDYGSLYTTEQMVTESFRKDILYLRRDLSSAREALSSSVAGFSVFSDKFVELFQATGNDIRELQVLVEVINSIQERLQQIHDASAERMQSIMDAGNLQSWDIRNSRLQEIIQRFTIFNHKKRAGEIGGFEVEGGVEEGGVTFF